MYKTKDVIFGGNIYDDHRSVVNHHYYRTMFDDVDEARMICDLICKRLRLGFNCVYFTGRVNKRDMAYCYYTLGRITLSKYGESLGVLLHEICHFKHIEHDHKFKEYQLKVYEVAKEILRKHKIRIRRQK